MIIPLDLLGQRVHDNVDGAVAARDEGIPSAQERHPYDQHELHFFLPGKRTVEAVAHDDADKRDGNQRDKGDGGDQQVQVLEKLDNWTFLLHREPPLDSGHPQSGSGKKGAGRKLPPRAKVNQYDKKLKVT